MVSFDKELWEKRARKRHAKGVGSSPPTGALSLELKAIADLGTLIGWCSERSVVVEFGNISKGTGASFDCEANIVKLSSRFIPERQLFLLLHECGHMLIGTRRKHERYGMGYNVQNISPENKTLRHRFDVLDEEMEAWFRGLKLAKRLKFKINKEAFHAFRLRYLKLYATWAIKPGDFENE